MFVITCFYYCDKNTWLLIQEKYQYITKLYKNNNNNKYYEYIENIIFLKGL